MAQSSRLAIPGIALGVSGMAFASAILGGGCSSGADNVSGASSGAATTGADGSAADTGRTTGAQGSGIPGGSSGASGSSSASGNAGTDDGGATTAAKPRQRKDGAIYR